ncbi:MAG: KpsF/GutQ family sugar-phosphate isomerase [Candidatus Coatesbacteria bacterium]|nr:MAG: KpsF/GutQ family sugar-phosphate isomerase [Candidatus Coatesbacteria bacterium]
MTADYGKDARRVIGIEAEAVRALADQVDAGFEGAVAAILASEGRVILLGIGKSGIIAQKIAATLSSTGTAAFFLHPAEGAHGDLGMVRAGDVAVAVSYSGETPEIVSLVPALKAVGVTLVAMTGHPGSSLAREADYVVRTAVDQEACPLGLVPTASTTAALVMGDALAVAAMRQRNFREEDFAAVHPGGTLGRRLVSTVAALGHTGEEIPQVSETATFAEAVAEMSAKGFGITAVTDETGRLVGVITDGDVRRAYERGLATEGHAAADVMTRDPKTVDLEAPGARALHLMERYQITALFAADEEGRPQAILHIHDVLGRGAAIVDFE